MLRDNSHNFRIADDSGVALKVLVRFWAAEHVVLHGYGPAIGSGKIESVLESSGPPLGLFDDSHFVTSALPLAPQQLVILLTDGAAETTASEDVEFGTDGVLEYVRDHRHHSARDLAEGIYRATRVFAGDEPQRDDVTDVIIKIA